MKPHANDDLERWLAAERRESLRAVSEAAADAERAEAALAALFAALPLAAPPAGFAERVLARAGLAPQRGLLARAWVRLALGLALAGAGALAAVAPQLFRGLLAALDPAALLTAGPRLLAAASEGAVKFLALALKLLDVANAVTAPFTSPSVAAALLVALAVAAAALRLLHHLIAHERSWSYVDAHG